MFKSGFVSIVGRPNVGKSTLMNNVVGEKIAIMSDKPQTTRNTIQAVYTDDESQVVFLDTPGIHKPKNKLGEIMVNAATESDKPQTTRNTIQAVYTDDESQVVFLDTPGIHKPKNKLGEIMVNAATDAFSNVDLILFVVDSSRKIGPGARRIMEDLRGSKTPIVLVINKIDQIEDKDELFDIIKMYDDEKMFKEIVPISALKGKNVKTLINVIKEDLEEGPKYFPDYMVTDQPKKNRTWS